MPGGINAYAYCGNDPVNHYDPTGNYKFFRPWITSSPVSATANNLPSTSTTRLNTTRRTAGSIQSRNRTLSSLQDNTINKTPNSVPSASTSSSQFAQFNNLNSAPPVTSAQNLPANKLLTPSGQFKRELKTDAQRFDEYVKNHPQTNVEYNPHLQAKISELRNELKKASTAAPASDLNRIVSSITYKELRLKRDAIRKIEGRAGKPTINK